MPSTFVTDANPPARKQQNITFSVVQHTPGLSRIEDSQAVETQFSHNQLAQLLVRLPVRLPEQLHNLPIVGLTDHSLVELVRVAHSPAGWLVQHMQGHYHKQDLGPPDSHNPHCLQLAAQDNLVVKTDMTHSHHLQELARTQLLLVHQAVQM